MVTVGEGKNGEVASEARLSSIFANIGLTVYLLLYDIDFIAFAYISNQYNFFVP